MALIYFAEELKSDLMEKERKLHGFVSRKNIDPAVRETYQRRIFVPEELLEVGYMNDFEKKRMLKYAAPGCSLDEVILFANHYHDDTPKFMPGNSTCKQGTVIAKGGAVSRQSRIVHPGFKSPVSIGRIEVSGQPVSSAPERQTAVLDVSIPPYIVKPGDVLGIES